MSHRLADYFVIVGYDRENITQGKILQRFPDRDWEDAPFIEGIELFCQPAGWVLSLQQEEPKYYMSVLTNVDGNHYYCAVLSFYEKVSIVPSKPVDEEEENFVNFGKAQVLPTSSAVTITHHNIMYAPKCLALVSSLDYSDTFKNCLKTIYTVYLESLPFMLETLIGNILGCIRIPSAGGPQVRFSIGAGDRQALQPPLSSSLPVTGNCVQLLFSQLGKKNVLLLYCAAMTENKILFHSSSYTRLSDSCRALTALMYPLRYTHTYVPLLPASILEILSTPTPFIMGIHSSMQNEINDMLDVIVADLDGGSIHIPESLLSPVSKLPAAVWETTNYSLTTILQPELAEADNAFHSSLNREMNDSRNPNLVDKELRAVFMRCFAQLMQGYRSCLTLIRINPKPVIEFHKAAFLGSRELPDTDFLARVLDSMFFTTFVTERGPPWRQFDAFDELYNAMPELLKSELKDRRLIVRHIQELAQKLFHNESPNVQNYQQKILSPPEGASSRIHQPEFPAINAQQVQTIIHEGVLKNDLQSRLTSYRNNPRIVPIGPLLPSYNDGRPVLTHTVRKMEVIKNCVSCLFENKISDARKIFPAVIRILKQRDDARLFLCREIGRFVQGSNKATLDHAQFDMVCKLMNRALQDDSPKFQHDIAASLLPLSISFCRKLSPTAMQFAYSCIQGHAIWKTQTFWEQAFFQEVQSNIKNLYINKPIDRNNHMNESMHSIFSSSNDYRTSQEPSALEIAAKQMMEWSTKDGEKQKEYMNSEEQILYSQALHYANRMISLLVPLEIRSFTKVKKFTKTIEDDASVSNSVLESRSDQSTDCFEERDSNNELEQNVIRSVCKFIDKVCNEGGVTAEHIRKLHSIIPGLVDMQCDTIDTIYRELKRIPPVQKPKIQFPSILSGEELIGEPIRAILLVDGREEIQSPLLPAEGALFLSNYRVIFKGMPLDSLTCEQNVIRSFPVASLTKEKRISGILSNEQVLPDGLQLRSATFQLIKIAFDEEVNQESIELFRKMLNRARHPEDEFGYFAFATNHLVVKPNFPKVKEKNATLKGFAKKTLLRTARKAGFKQKSTTKRKYIFSGANDIESFYSAQGGANNNNNSDDDEEASDDIESIPRVTVKDVEKLKERNFVKDWQRLNLISNGFRISSINCNYSLCRTYPALIVCPKNITDEQLKTLAKSYKNQRFPVPTWRHPTNGAVLLRSALSLAKGVMGMLKSANSSANTSIEGKVDGLQDQDRFYCAIIPQHHQQSVGVITSSESNMSIDSLLSGGKNHFTPMMSNSRKNESNISKTNNNNFKLNKYESLKRNVGGLKDCKNIYNDPYSLTQQHHHHSRPQRVPLYFLGERSQSKSIRLSELGVEYIPVYYNDNRHSRDAFKKLMRACLPSNINNEPDHTFVKLIEQSEWLLQIKNLLQLSGTVVDLIDLHEANVNLSFEDGWDYTCQISSLAQICLDPFYRTLEGFRVLIEKEWLAFGHRFGHRSNLKPNSSAYAPIFLQFLDALHQILVQFPLSFEYNDFYLKFIAYHSVSCRFRTFLFDSELDRYEWGITAAEDKRGSLNSHKHMVDTGTNSDDETVYPGGLRTSNSNQQKIGTSIFDYIEKYHVRSSVFYNFKYTPDQSRVLRPQYSNCMLEVWDYYTNEELAQGPPYDLELIGSETVEEEPEYSTKHPKRKVVTSGYDNIYRCDIDAFTHLLDELKQAEAEKGILPQKWKQVWDRLELPHSGSLTRHTSTGNALVRSLGRNVQNFSTIEVLRRGQLSCYQDSFSHPHRFEKHAYTTPTHCNLCGNLLWGPVRNGLRCMDCGNAYHEKCSENAPNSCTKYKSIEGAQTLMPNEKQETGSITSNNTNDIYRGFESQMPENRTHEGYLYKRGALLKGWKQRWFVLDSIKHQLRYYDSDNDCNCKGAIDLAEVQSVGQAVTPFQITGSKKIDEKAFFDLKTAKRTYNFCAIDTSSSQEWIEKIQACIQ